MKSKDGTTLKALFLHESTLVTHFMTSVQIWDIQDKENAIIRGSLELGETLKDGV
jgi:hypothetical protein